MCSLNLSSKTSSGNQRKKNIAYFLCLHQQREMEFALEAEVHKLFWFCCFCRLCGFAVVKDFVLIGQHTCPKNAMKEIDQLYNVFNTIHKNWKTDVGWTLACPDGFTCKHSLFKPCASFLPLCLVTPSERGDLGRPERWLQLRYHQGLEGSAPEERGQVSLADRGRAGHDRSPEDALCLRQVRGTVLLLRLSPEQISTNNVSASLWTGLSCTVERWFPASFQDQLSHSTLKRPSVSARRR